MSILIFFAVLFVLILVHELGHFWVAKWTGMRVDEFGIGFPPRIAAIVRGETTYSVNALPIGGFVKIFGENGGCETDAAATASRSFAAKSVPAKAAVLVAGVGMNVLLAWVLFLAVFLMGVPMSVPADAASPAAALTITEVLPDGPVADAGLKPGTKIIAAANDTRSLTEPTTEEFQALVRAGEPVTITYEWAGERGTAQVTPEPALLEGDERPAVGVALSLVEITRYGFGEALWEATRTTVHTLGAVCAGIANLLWGALQLDANLSNVAGPVGIVTLVGDAAAVGISSLLIFTAVISLNLAVINLLPFPALDGGRLLFVLIEAVRRRPLHPAWEARANTIGFVLLLVLMLAITVNDVLRLL